MAGLEQRSPGSVDGGIAVGPRIRRSGQSRDADSLDLGLAIVVFAGIAVYMPKAWEEALNIILGICLLASPWALGYSDQARPATNALVVGLLVTVLAVWAMLMDTAVQKWWHERRLTR